MKAGAYGALPKCSLTPRVSSVGKPKPSSGWIDRQSVWIIASRSICYARIRGRGWSVTASDRTPKPRIKLLPRRALISRTRPALDNVPDVGGLTRTRLKLRLIDSF
jgi:hypothetical protein